MAACGAVKITIKYSAGGNVLSYKIECEDDGCKEFGRLCKEVRYDQGIDDWTKFCACREVDKDGKYDSAATNPPDEDTPCKYIALDSAVDPISHKRSYNPRCLGAKECAKAGKECKRQEKEHWETETDKDGWERDVRIVEYSCQCA